MSYPLERFNPSADHDAYAKPAAELPATPADEAPTSQEPYQRSPWYRAWDRRREAVIGPKPVLIRRQAE